MTNGVDLCVGKSIESMAFLNRFFRSSLMSINLPHLYGS